MKKNLIVVFLFIIFVFLVYNWYVNKSATTKIINNNDSEIPIVSSEDEKIEVYSYTYPYLNPNISVEFPSNWEKNECSASGCWDITLSEGNDIIQIDLSGQGDSTFEQSLDDWITNWGSFQYNYTFEISEQGRTKGGFEYKLFEVLKEDNQEYFISIVDIGEMYGGRAHLAVKVNNGSLVSQLKHILNSIEPI